MPHFLTQLTYYVAILVGLVFALFMGESLGSGEFGMVALIFGALLGIIWVIGSGDRWWFPMPYAVGMGGVFYVPFKLFPHEIALGICGIVLGLRIPFKGRELGKPRPKLPIVFFLLVAYLLAHLAVSLMAFRGGPGLGNISRAYMHALWAPLFGYAYYRYGSTKNIQAGFRLFYCAVIIRVAFGLVNAYFDEVFIVPLINYSLDPQDLRTSGNMLLILSGLACVASKGSVARVGHALVCLFASGIWLALGGSRGQLVGTLAFIAALCVFFRWRVTFFVLATSVGIAFAFLNISPSVIEPLPYRLQRSLTAFMINAPLELDVQEDVKGSNLFRQVISAEGYDRWTSTTRTILVGTGMRPFDENYFANASRFELEVFTLLIQNAADVGAYETALWSILAVTGLVGAGLFVFLILSILMRMVPVIPKLRVEGYGWVCVAWAAASLVCYLLLAPFGGGFPSFELFLSLIALAYIEDVRPTLKRPTLPEVPVPNILEMRTAREVVA
ncbi:hypothetical protein AYO41_04395 [Verrucomicrobia bacterium SCGC AG-212-E04]|nr:hypothetical protein AYO41_04395 [Verrucomicrobia bacterium SCGC AG-212-E04]